VESSPIQEIEEMGGYFFSIEEVGIITGADMSAAENLTAYRRGSLKAEAEIRKVIIQQAKDGSGPAQTAAQKLIDTLKRKNH
jgi:hypothetical protein